MAGTRYGATGANITTETQEHRDAQHAAMLRAGAARAVPPVPVLPSTDVVAVTETHWPPMALALLRGAIEGFVLGGLDALTALSLDFSTRDSLISAGVIFFARLAIALGVGGIDQWNAAKERHI
jgi:hypothetical protein